MWYGHRSHHYCSTCWPHTPRGQCQEPARQSKETQSPDVWEHGHSGPRFFCYCGGPVGEGPPKGLGCCLYCHRPACSWDCMTAHEERCLRGHLDVRAQCACGKKVCQQEPRCESSDTVAIAEQAPASVNPAPPRSRRAPEYTRLPWPLGTLVLADPTVRAYVGTEAAYNGVWMSELRASDVLATRGVDPYPQALSPPPHGLHSRARRPGGVGHGQRKYRHPRLRVLEEKQDRKVVLPYRNRRCKLARAPVSVLLRQLWRRVAARPKSTRATLPHGDDGRVGTSYLIHLWANFRRAVLLSSLSVRPPRRDWLHLRHGLVHRQERTRTAELIQNPQGFKHAQPGGQRRRIDVEVGVRLVSAANSARGVLTQTKLQGHASPPKCIECGNVIEAMFGPRPCGWCRAPCCSVDCMLDHNQQCRLRDEEDEVFLQRDVFPTQLRLPRRAAREARTRRAGTVGRAGMR